MQLTRMFAPPGVQTPDQELDVVVSVVQQHKVSTQLKATGALRLLDPIAKTLSPRSLNRRALAAIDRAEGIARSEPATDKHILRRDRKKCEALRSTMGAQATCQDRIISNRRMYGTSSRPSFSSSAGSSSGEIQTRSTAQAGSSGASSSGVCARAALSPMSLLQALSPTIRKPPGGIKMTATLGGGGAESAVSTVSEDV